MAETVGSYRVSEAALHQLKIVLDGLGRKSAKLGLEPITYEVGPGFEIAHKRIPGGRTLEIKSEADFKRAEATGRLIFRRFHMVTVSGQKPRLAGWEFAATLQHLADEQGNDLNMLRTVPGFKGDLPEKFRTASPFHCDHCHREIRSRKETFVLRHEGGDFKQVGRNCTQDFLGGKDPHAVAMYAEYLLRMETACSEEGGGFGSHETDSVTMSVFLAHVAAVIRIDGWLSRGKARLNEMGPAATADLVGSIFAPPPRDSELYAKWKAFVEAHQPEARDIELATKALTYAREDLSEKAERSDYEHNLFVAMSQPTVSFKLMGIAASLVPYYLREVERQAVREAEMKRNGASVYFGEVGKRQDFYVTVTRIIPYENRFGTSFIHKFTTREGNVATWFASVNPELEPGTEYRITATVKAHEEFKGVKQTVLTRCTVYTEQGRADAEAKDAKKAAKLAKAAAPQVGGETKWSTPFSGFDPCHPEKPAVSDELTAKRKEAARKAVETRRARLAAEAAKTA
jgi:hypothetical protein